MSKTSARQLRLPHLALLLASLQHAYTDQSRRFPEEKRRCLDDALVPILCLCGVAMSGTRILATDGSVASSCLLRI
ncbi:hypothetical protein IWX47DRAFT_172882 [Phyllosticta citricarpa]